MIVLANSGRYYNNKSYTKYILAELLTVYHIVLGGVFETNLALPLTAIFFSIFISTMYDYIYMRSLATGASTFQPYTGRVKHPTILCSKQTARDTAHARMKHTPDAPPGAHTTSLLRCLENPYSRDSLDIVASGNSGNADLIASTRASVITSGGRSGSGKNR